MNTSKAEKHMQRALGLLQSTAPKGFGTIGQREDPVVGETYILPANREHGGNHLHFFARRKPDGELVKVMDTIPPNVVNKNYEIIDKDGGWDLSELPLDVEQWVRGHGFSWCWRAKKDHIYKKEYHPYQINQ